MPKSCAVYQCSATAATNKDSSFHQIPKDPKLRETWVKKIRREDFVPSASSYVCSFHFGEEDFSKGNPNTPLQFQKKSLKKGAIPMWNLRGTEGDQRISSRTFFTSHCARSSEPASEGEELPSMEQNADEVDPPTTTEKDPFQEVEQLQMKLTDARAEIERLKPRIFNFSTLTNDEIRNYTGLESSKFLAVVEMIESFQPLTYWSGKTDIPNCRIIIDCTEFQIETPRKNLEAAATSYSNYKHRLTAKYLIGVTPNGSITFVSDGYPGSTSDKVVTDQSHIISNLKVCTYDPGTHRRLFDELAQDKGAIQHL
eukprot:gene10116-18778_t